MAIVMQPSNTTTLESEVNQNKVLDYQLAKSIYMGVRRSYLFVWKNPKGRTPMEVLAQYGTDAKELFVLCTQLQQIVAPLLGAEFKPLNVPPEYDVTLNDDGTVTCVKKETV